MSKTSPEIKDKVSKLFSYIREFAKLKIPPVSQANAYDWSLKISSLPSYPSIQKFSIDDPEFDGTLLRIKRPNEKSCPPPPVELKEWLESGWENLSSEAKVIVGKNKTDQNGHTYTEKFDGDAARVKSYQDWLQKRTDWLEAEKPVREASAVFSDFFKLHGQLQRESERYQLYIADGHFLWNSMVSSIDHPILLKKIEIEFDSAVPEFIIREADDETELFTSLLRYHEMDGTGILDCKNRILKDEPHPLGNGKTVEFLKYFIQRFFENGKFCEIKDEVEEARPCIYRDPTILMATRTQGFAEAIDRLIDAIPNAESLPEALLRIVGVDTKISQNQNTSDGLNDSTSFSNTKIDFLLTKPANKEQERVITRLEQTGSVLVQGPPGTGKSHTIANIIGHLLANGKTVLVASHTSKALKVVREKVVEPLKPLCVSVLDNDTESKAQLEESINGIVSYLSRADESSIESEIVQLGQRRQQLTKLLEAAEQKALEICKSEYVDIIVAGEGLPPSEAARKVSELEEKEGWIPAPLSSGATLPLSEEQIHRLYNLNGQITIDEEKCLQEGVVYPESILSPSEMRSLASEMSGMNAAQTKSFENYWKDDKQNLDSLNVLETKLEKAFNIFSAHTWIKKVVEDSRLGENHVQPWVSLIELIESQSQKIAKRTEAILNHGPQIHSNITPELLNACRDILLHLRSGKSLGFFNLTFNSTWKELLAVTRVDEGQPSRDVHFEAILYLMETKLMRQELIRRWERQVVALGGVVLDSNQPEIHAKSFIDGLRVATSWSNHAWHPIESDLTNLGFNIKQVSENVSLTTKSSAYIDQVNIMVSTIIKPAIEERKLYLKLSYLEEKKDKTIQALKINSKKSANMNQYLELLINSVQSLDSVGYEKAYSRLIEILSKAHYYEERKNLLKLLAPSAPAWANAIENRVGIHNSNAVLGNVKIAWNVAQWKQELEKRLSQDYSAAQHEIQRLKAELMDVNAQYVEKLAWRFQLKRTGLAEKQALTGWQQIQNRITKTGRGKRDPHLKREARQILKNCKNAVPVWVMPLSKVFDSFDLIEAKFDVILLDEASQSDIMALAAFAVAKQVIVVGDNEQVTPYAVGQELGKIQSLIDEMLQGIPNRQLYDGKTSIYDLAEQAFGETIRLVEHFRCVPDIIQFSNQLSYNGEIKPLREASSSPFKQHLIAHRVEGAMSLNKVNLKEATEVASMVAAMTEFQEYEHSSIGVISMVGQEQAITIDSILQKRLPTHKYAKHNLLTGNASQFQGDERDVVLISMVDSCEAPPLSIRQTPEFKKTFNVAASRARNQLWVVHSLNPNTDLKPNDLRLRLINHAEDPNNLKNTIEATQRKADPKSVVFEPMVIRDLMNAGFRIIPQWSVGAYTIDMIVQGASKRIAVECDGDRFHPPEKLADDMQRQQVLERLGWKFIRIRGSEYFRSREATIKRVIAELDSLNIERLGLKSEAISTDENSDELRRRVLIRASQIRDEWSLLSDDDEPKPKAKTWNRWGKKGSTAGEASNTELSTKAEDNDVSIEQVKQEQSPPSNLVQDDIDPILLNKISTLKAERIVEFLKEQQFEVIDKRPVSGSLWVVDNPQFRKQVKALNSRGWQFTFAENGSGSTKDRPAWYTKNDSRKAK